MPILIDVQSEKGRKFRGLPTLTDVQSDKGRMYRGLPTLIDVQSEKGRVQRMSMQERNVRSNAQSPGPSPSKHTD